MFQPYFLQEGEYRPSLAQRGPLYGSLISFTIGGIAGASAWLVSSFLPDNSASLSSLSCPTQPNSISFLVFVLSWVCPMALSICLVFFVTFLLGPSFLGRLAHPSAWMERRRSLPLSVLFVGAPSTSRASIGLHGPIEVVDYLCSAWPLKLAMKGAIGPKLLWGAFLDFHLMEAWDGMVGGTTYNGGVNVSLARMVSSLVACDWKGHLV